ncbi:hypothetical protein CEK25_013043 [Fusarium fujikuroi]|nr:hypothetical protein CEK25_013043 [Fusarium fujikuroi]
MDWQYSFWVEFERLVPTLLAEVQCKTMKKNFARLASSFALSLNILPCSRSRHLHLDPYTKIFILPWTMEGNLTMDYMKGNRDQLKKSR